MAKGRQLCGNMAANVRVNEDLFRAFPGRSADAIKGLRRTAKYRDLRQRLSEGGPPTEDPIDYERPWEARLRTVAGGLPPPLNAEQMHERARLRPEPANRKGPKLRWTAGEMNEMAAAEERLLGAHRGRRNTNINLNRHVIPSWKTRVNPLGRMVKIRHSD